MTSSEIYSVIVVSMKINVLIGVLTPVQESMNIISNMFFTAQKKKKKKMVLFEIAGAVSYLLSWIRKEGFYNH